MCFTTPPERRHTTSCASELLRSSSTGSAPVAGRDDHDQHEARERGPVDSKIAY